MKYLPILLCLLAVSCAKKPPAPPLIPKVTVDVIDTTAVSKATRETRKAVREVVSAGDTTRSTAAELRAEIDRAQLLVAENETLKISFVKIQAISARLNTALLEAQAREQNALLMIDSQDDTIANLNTTVARQSEQIKLKEATDESLRAQVKKLSTVSDDLAVAKDKLSFWRWAGLITWGIVALYIAARVFLRAVIPFRF